MERPLYSTIETWVPITHSPPRAFFPPNPRSWWRHQMETFSALLAICAENSPVPGEFPAQRPVTRSFDVYFDLRPNKGLSDLRRNRAHYDVIVMNNLRSFWPKPAFQKNFVCAFCYDLCHIWHINRIWWTVIQTISSTSRLKFPPYSLYFTEVGCRGCNRR